MRDGKKRRKLAAEMMLIGACLYLLVNLGLLWREYTQYQEKEELLFLAAEEGGSRIGHVTGYLKGEYRPAVADSRRRLEKLGFSKSYRDTLKKQFARGIRENLLLTAAVFAAAAACGALLLKHFGCEEEKQLQRMCDAVAAVRAGAGTGQLFWLGETQEQDDFGRLRMEVASLAEQADLAVERAGREKECTKALVTDLSHQLRTPLAALRTSFEVLENGADCPAGRLEFLPRCREQLVHLEELLNALLQISRMETGLIELRLRKAPVFDTLLSAVGRIYPKADGKGIEIVLEESAAGDEHQVIRQDTHWLSEALINILENAVKYSPGNTTVRIRVQRMTLYLRMEIEDQGIGIPADERNLIWQRFYRGRSSKVQREKGQGIGLYLTRLIIEKHGGTIRAESASGGGSRFLIHLPYESLTEV